MFYQTHNALIRNPPYSPFVKGDDSISEFIIPYSIFDIFKSAILSHTTHFSWSHRLKVSPSPLPSTEDRAPRTQNHFLNPLTTHCPMPHALPSTPARTTVSFSRAGSNQYLFSPSHRLLLSKSLSHFVTQSLRFTQHPAPSNPARTTVSFSRAGSTYFHCILHTAYCILLTAYSFPSSFKTPLSTRISS